MLTQSKGPIHSSASCMNSPVHMVTRTTNKQTEITKIHQRTCNLMIVILRAKIRMKEYKLLSAAYRTSINLQDSSLKPKSQP